jgi:molybdenum cofactor biosynthesis enzyme MoaA
MHSSGDEFEKKKTDLQRILSWLEKFDNPITIELSGNGDPLASGIIRPLFQNYQPKVTQKFNLKTNGLLIKKQLLKSNLLNNINCYSISVDAGSSDIYKKVRCGGSWTVLLENFDFLLSIGQEKKVTLNFALQKNNFRDVFNFVDLCSQYNFFGLIHQLDDWGTWNTDTVINADEWTIANGTFVQHNVLNKQHADYQECKKIVESARSFKNIVFSSNILHLLEIS